VPTPPSRRRPVTPPTTPVRRPKVAGLHRPHADTEQADSKIPEPTDSTAELSTAQPIDPQPTEQTPKTPATPIDWAGAVPPERVGAGRGSVEAENAADAADESTVADELDESESDGAEARRVGSGDESGDVDVVSPAVLGVDEEADHVPSPRPSGKRRATGIRVPQDLAAAERGQDADDDAVDERSPEEVAAAARNRSINLAITLAVVALVFAGLALWFRGEANSLTGGADGTNHALTDSAATSEVQGKLTVAIEKTLSYNFTDLDATAKAVKDNLAGNAVCEYDKLFGQLKELAPAQKLVLTTKVRQLGVTRLDGDKADLLVFVDQSTTRTDQNQTTASGAQFGIRAEKIDGAWKITDFDMLDQPLPDGKPAPSC
jgi:Mce-associated membrane protein